MKQQKLSGYKPNYPKKAVRGMALAAAALMTVGVTAGCRTRTEDRTGAGVRSVFEILFPAEEVQTDGYVAPEETPEPEDLRMGGIAMPEETPEPEEPPMLGGVPMPEPTPEPEEIEWMGDVMVVDEP